MSSTCVVCHRAGAVASGRVPAEGHGDLWTSWTGPTSLVGGTLAVLTCAFIAATFLAADELQVVRAEVKRAYELQVAGMAAGG